MKEKYTMLFMNALVPSKPSFPIKVGSKGKHVKFIQSKLGLVEDGIFGPQTKFEVMEFQKKKGLTIKVGYEDHPVVGVTWHGAQAYCKWRSALERSECRLPTEAEWEKAARGCLGRRYPWGNDFAKEKCNTDESGIEDTSKTGSFPDGRSAYGCLDMAGNVLEWCQDDYQRDFYRIFHLKITILHGLTI